MPNTMSMIVVRLVGGHQYHICQRMNFYLTATAYNNDCHNLNVKIPMTI